MRLLAHLSIYALASVVTASDGIHPRRQEAVLRRQYESSKARCTHGQAGVIVILSDNSSRTPHALKQHVNAGKGVAERGDRVHHVFSNPHTIRGISARLSEESLNELFAAHHIHNITSIHADCMIDLRKHFAKATPNMSPRHSTSLVSSMGRDEGMMYSATITKGEQSTDTGWGLARADQSEGPGDNRYDFGKATGNGTTLYLIDTGVQFGHEDFRTYDSRGKPNGNKILDGFSMGCTDPKTQKEECSTIWVYGGDVGDSELNRVNKYPSGDGRGFSGQTPPGMGCDAHGTHTASTVLGNKHGVAKEARMVVIQGLSCVATAQDSMVVKALDWVVQHARAQTPFRPSVVLLSLGGEKDTILNEAVRRTTQHYVNVVVAAGNDHTDACSTTPSSVDTATTVAAVDQDLVVTSFSSYGKCVDVCAPGSEVKAAYAEVGSNASTRTLSGTSMAAPFVAGAMLQALQLFPQMSTTQTKMLISCTTTRGVVYGDNEVVSSGTPNAFVRLGKVFESADALKAAIRQQRTVSAPVTRMASNSAVRAAVLSTATRIATTQACLDLVEQLERTRPRTGIVASSPDHDMQSVIIPESMVPPSPPLGVLDDRPYTGNPMVAKADVRRDGQDEREPQLGKQREQRKKRKLLRHFDRLLPSMLPQAYHEVGPHGSGLP